MFYLIGSILLLTTGMSLGVYLINKGYKDYVLVILLGYALSSFFLPSVALYNKINYMEKNNAQLLQYLKEKDTRLKELHKEKEELKDEVSNAEKQLLELEQSKINKK